MDSCRRTDRQHQTPPPKGRGQTTQTEDESRGHPLAPRTWPLCHRRARPKMVTRDATRRAGTNATRPSSRQPGSCTCQRHLVPGLGVAPVRACLASLWKPQELRKMVDFVKPSGSRQACPRDYTNIHPSWGLRYRHDGAAATALRPRDLTPSQPREPPEARQGPAPLAGRTLLDRHGREKAGKGLCLPGRRQPAGAPLLCAQPGPQGTDSNLGGPRAQLSAGRGRSWSLSDSGWLWARSGLGLAGGSGCCTDMVRRRWLRFRRNSGCAWRPKLPLRRIIRELFFLGRERWPASSAAKCAA